MLARFVTCASGDHLRVHRGADRRGRWSASRGCIGGEPSTLRVEQQEQQLTNGTLIVTPPKTAAGIRTLALPAFLVVEFEGHLAKYAAPGPSGRVFPGEKGGSLRNLTLHAHWSRARAAAGHPETFRFHDLRHTANTLTGAAGASTAGLMARMGHSSHQAALRYQHATKDRDAGLAAALDGFVLRQRPNGFENAHPARVLGQSS